MDKKTLEKCNNVIAQIHNLDKEIKAMDKVVNELNFMIEQAESECCHEYVRIVYGDGRGININAVNIIGTLKRISDEMSNEREKLEEVFKHL